MIGLLWCVWAVDRVMPRPPPLEPRASCSLWKGTASGNDPSVQIELELCGEAGALRGRVQWSSTRSGSNVRTIRGERDAEGLHLRDSAMTASNPAPGWRFCLIDRYDLRVVSPDRLVGRYRSVACRDAATLTLERVRGGLPSPEREAPRAVEPVEESAPSPEGCGDGWWFGVPVSARG